MDGLIINVALTGCVHNKADNLALPITPEDVAADARRCADLGASMFHLHARDEAGNPACGREVYKQYVNAVREAVPGAVIVVSCSGRHFHSFSERSASIGSGADMASLTMGSVDFRDSTSENGTSMVNALLREMNKYGVGPECEVFDLGHYFRLQGLELKRPYVNIILGVHLPPTLEMLLLLKQSGPLVGATAIGKDAWQVQRWAIGLGCHVRVGLEDSLWMDKGDPATNARLVERAVSFGRSLGREPISAREVL